MATRHLKCPPGTTLQSLKARRSLTGVTATERTDVTLYWRPGCPFCSRLTAAMRAEGIEYRAVNIWDDPDAAAFVRSVANGNETVPTVTVGSVALVNPPVERIVELLPSERPEPGQ